jgi:aspartyl-tRNA(Asn)/glutamyl-tRNA(Gln) amidotransferase subunit C
MNDQISPELFKHLIQLAALEFSADEAEYLRVQLNNQLKAIQELEQIPVALETPIAAHGVPYTVANSQPLRQDQWQPFPKSMEILEQAPETDACYIIVPEIPHTELD